MSIRDVARINKERHQREVDAKHSQEADARPEPFHRAIKFLLEQAIQNNRDCRPEADHYLRLLDAEYADAEKLKALDAPPPKPEEEEEEPAAIAEAPGQESIAEQVRRTPSRRFQRRAS